MFVISCALLLLLFVCVFGSTLSHALFRSLSISLTVPRVMHIGSESVWVP